MQRVLPKLAVAGTSAGGVLFACHRLEGHRTPLRDRDGCRADTIPAALTSLRNSGVAVVDALRLEPEVVGIVRAMPAAEGMPTRLRRPPQRRERRRGPAGMMPVDETWRQSALGRYHRTEDHLAAADVEVLERIERRLWPLVEEFFREEEGGADGVYRSELQLMTAVPGSGDQSWHRDNRARGLSILVPLVDFRAANGGTQLLLGSHAEGWPVLGSSGGGGGGEGGDRGGDHDRGARVAHVPAGSVLAYDSRTIHRGLGNETDEARPALIFCYDRVGTPPPGCGTLGSVATSYQGRMVDILSGARNALASLAD